MRVVSAEFMKSAERPEQWPPAGPPELAFVGRSNSGKSSLLNMLVGRKGLARTSQTPGRTRLINFFHVVLAEDGDARRELVLVDLPGFGYARVAREERSTWRPAVERYLADRTTLAAVALLMDARRGAELDERELAPWIASAAHGVTVVPVLTKIDKLAKHERRLAVDRTLSTLGMRPIATSATSGEGRDELWRRLLAAIH
jgi:GTP-binding protein